MSTNFRRAVAVLFWLMLIADLYAWAGFSLDPELGIAVSKSVRREGVLSRAYMEAGRPLVELAGLQHSAVSYADARFGNVRAAVKANPEAAMDLIGDGMSGLLWITHHGAPLAGFVWLILWWQRPREVHVSQRR